MIIEKQLVADGGVMAEWSARVACDFRDCDRVLSMSGFIGLSDILTDAKIERHLVDEGWYVGKGRHLCKITDEELEVAQARR